MTTKAQFEEMCRRAEMAPVMRGAFEYGEIYIADGFTKSAHKNFRKFGIGPEDFPSGCYATVWSLFQDDEFFMADALFFDPMHDLSHPNRQDARVRKAMQRAEEFAEMLKNVKENPISDKQARETEEFFENFEENNRKFQEFMRDYDA